MSIRPVIPALVKIHGIYDLMANLIHQHVKNLRYSRDEYRIFHVSTLSGIQRHDPNAICYPRCIAN